MRTIACHCASDAEKMGASLGVASEKEGLLAEALANSNVPFAIWNPDGSLVFYNPAFVALTGYSTRELDEPHIDWDTALTPDEWQPQTSARLAESLLSRQPVCFEKEYRRKDGVLVPIEISLQPVFDPAGNHRQNRVFLTDITQRKQKTAALEQALEQTMRASLAKSEFLTSLSHEVRTPMNAILGYTQILQRDVELSSEVKNKLAMINRSGASLLHILNDILDLAKIEAGQVSVNPVEFNLEELLDDLLRLFRQPTKDKHLSIGLYNLNSVPEFIRADQDKIRQILVNLLGNAVKFTQKGGIQLQFSVRNAAAGRMHLVLAVADTGPGIGLEELPGIFEKYQQANAGQQAHSGVGLGLALSRQYARLMGGDITVQSQLGKGSLFQFEVPVEPVADKPGETKNPRRALVRFPSDMPTCRVLIVDDFEVNRAVLAQLLKINKFEVRTASTGEEALAICAEWLPQLVLMDICMPGMDGNEAIRRLRADERHQAMKIITVSAMVYPEDQARTLEAGADAFVSKPVGLRELLQKITSLLGLDYVQVQESKAKPVEASSSSGPLTAAALAALPADWRNQLREAVIDADFNQAIALINLVIRKDPKTAAGLLKMASQFDGQPIIKLLDEAAEFV